jgi:hypothetical protein
MAKLRFMRLFVSGPEAISQIIAFFLIVRYAAGWAGGAAASRAVVINIKRVFDMYQTRI